MKADDIKRIIKELEEVLKQTDDEVFEEDGFVERIHSLGNGEYSLNAGGGYNAGIDVLCLLKDTGNGYIAHFHSYSNATQDNYICMGYDEADELRKLLTYIHKKGQK